MPVKRGGGRRRAGPGSMRVGTHVFELLARSLAASARVVGWRRAARIATAISGLVRQGPRASSGRLRENLEALFPERDADALAREVRANGALARVVDKFLLPHVPTDVLERAVTWEDDSSLRAALAERRGVVIVSLHYGRFWVVPTLLSRRGARVTAFQRGEGRLPAPGDALSGGTLSAQDLGSALKAVRELRKGSVVCVLLDAGRVENPLTLDFFGRPTRVPAAPVRIARSADALVVALLAAADGGDAERVRVRTAAVLDPRDLAPDATDAEATARLLGALERVVGEDPGQWLGATNADRRWA